jgi:hypothetical protein
MAPRGFKGARTRIQGDFENCADILTSDRTPVELQ